MIELDQVQPAKRTPVDEQLWQQVIDHFGFSEPFEQLDISRGVAAMTWVSDNYIVQRRPIELLPQFAFLRSFAATADFAGLSFQGPLIVENQGRFSEAGDSPGEMIWYALDRLQDGHHIYHQNIDGDQLVERSLAVLPQLIDQLTMIDDTASRLRVSRLPRLPYTEMQLCSRQQLIYWSNQSCPLDDNPLAKINFAEPRSHPVVGHGDPVLKNILVTSEGAVELLDFEALALMPRHVDLTHLAAFVCKHGESADWEEISLSHWQELQVLLPYWDTLDWQRALCYYLARELTVFPRQEAEINQEQWYCLARQVDRLNAGD